MATDILNLPVRTAGPANLQGLVDKLTGPAYSTSVGLLHWAQHESLVMPRVANGKKRGSGRPQRDLGRSFDLFKRLLP